MSRDTARQTALGLVFLVVGFALVALATLPAVLGVFAHPPRPAVVSLWILYTGLAVAVFGALLIPSSGAETALTVFGATVGSYLPKFGGKRAGDPPSVP